MNLNAVMSGFLWIISRKVDVYRGQEGIKKSL